MPGATLVTAPARYEDIDRDPVTRFETFYAAAYFRDNCSHFVAKHSRQLKGLVGSRPLVPIIDLDLTYADTTILDLK